MFKISNKYRAQVIFISAISFPLCRASLKSYSCWHSPQVMTVCNRTQQNREGQHEKGHFALTLALKCDEVKNKPVGLLIPKVWMVVSLISHFMYTTTLHHRLLLISRLVIFPTVTNNYFLLVTWTVLLVNVILLNSRVAIFDFNNSGTEWIFTCKTGGNSKSWKYIQVRSEELISYTEICEMTVKCLFCSYLP